MHVLTPRRVTILFFALLVAVSGAHAQSAERTVSNTVSLNADGTVYIDNHDGAISVTPWDRDEVQYEARITHKRHEGVDNTRIRVDASSRSLRLESDFDDIPSEGFWGGRSAPKVYYTLKVPAAASIIIDDHESSIDIRDLSGAVEIDTHDGSMSLASLSGDVEIDTHDGSMDFTNLTGRLEIDTHDSDLRATGLRGPVEIDTHDGDIDLQFAALDGPITIDSHDARATITLPDGTGFDLDSDMGRDADLDIEPSLTVSNIGGDSIRGTANGGGPRIKVSSHDGELRIRTRG